MAAPCRPPAAHRLLGVHMPHRDASLRSLPLRRAAFQPSLAFAVAPAHPSNPRPLRSRSASFSLRSRAAAGSPGNAPRGTVPTAQTATNIRPSPLVHGTAARSLAGALIALQLACAPLDPAAAAALPLPVAAAAAAAEAAAPSPYSKDAQNNPLGLLDGSIRPCPSGTNPNCVSTSSTNAAYAFPWTLPPATATAAAVQKVERVVKATQRNAAIVDEYDLPDGGHYFLALVDGWFGRDSVEVLVRDGSVFYRGMAGHVFYLYPFTTPLTDFGSQRRRMDAIGSELGWLQTFDNCDVSSGECFDY